MLPDEPVSRSERRRRRHAIRRWAERSNAAGAARKLLLALVKMAGPEGACSPSQKQLAQRLAVSLDTVQRALQRLRQLGLLEYTLRYDKRGKRTSNLYVLKVGNTLPPACEHRIAVAGGEP